MDLCTSAVRCLRQGVLCHQLKQHVIEGSRCFPLVTATGEEKVMRQSNNSKEGDICFLPGGGRFRRHGSGSLLVLACLSRCLFSKRTSPSRSTRSTHWTLFYPLVRAYAAQQPYLVVILFRSCAVCVVSCRSASSLYPPHNHSPCCVNAVYSCLYLSLPRSFPLFECVSSSFSHYCCPYQSLSDSLSLYPAAPPTDCLSLSASLSPQERAKVANQKFVPQCSVVRSTASTS